MKDKGQNNPDLKMLKLHLTQILDTAISDTDELKSLQKRETEKQSYKMMVCKLCL